MNAPLGNFDPSAPLLHEALLAGAGLYDALPDVPAGGLGRIYLHWAVAPFGCEFTDYNAMVDLKDDAWKLVVTHDPRDNVAGLNNNAPASHTWHRNTGAFGISIAGMDGATTSNFGKDPVELHELEYLCAGAAAVAKKYGIDTLGKVEHGSTHIDENGNNVDTAGEPTILTHGECAVIDSYPTERWDLGSLVPLADGESLTPAMRTQTGDALRARIHAYKLALP